MAGSKRSSPNQSKFVIYEWFWHFEMFLNYIFPHLLNSFGKFFLLFTKYSSNEVFVIWRGISSPKSENPVLENTFHWKQMPNTCDTLFPRFEIFPSIQHTPMGFSPVFHWSAREFSRTISNFYLLNLIFVPSKFPESGCAVYSGNSN